jgi:S1-C subfamily serine protease
VGFVYHHRQVKGEKMKKSFVIFSLFAGSLYGQTADISSVLENALRGVVTVEIMKSRDLPSFFGAAPKAASAPRIKPYQSSLYRSQADSSGSGFLVTRGNRIYVLTNAHVVQDASPDSIETVGITGERYAMKLLAVDTIRDVAVLTFAERPGPEMIPLTFRTAAPRVGERVYALGNPLGAFPSSASEGIVSALNRQAGIGATSTSGGNTLLSSGYIQTSAILSPGNSGGPLIDVRGNIVGINTWINRKSGSAQLNFSLNAKVVRDTFEQLVDGGRVRRGSLGLQVAAVGISKSVFVIVGVHDGVPVNVRDKLLNTELTYINGVRISAAEQLFSMLDQVKPGETVTLRVKEDSGRSTEASIVATEMTDKRLADLSNAYLTKFAGLQASADAKGAKISFVKSDFCQPALTRIVAGADEKKTQQLELPAAFVPTKGGFATENAALLYPIDSIRTLHLLVRVYAMHGGLVLVREIDDGNVEVLQVSPAVSGTPLQFVLN